MEGVSSTANDIGGMHTFPCAHSTDMLEGGLDDEHRLASPAASFSLPISRSEGQPLLSTPRLATTHRPSGPNPAVAGSVIPASCPGAREGPEHGRRVCFRGCFFLASAATVAALVGCMVLEVVSTRRRHSGGVASVAVADSSLAKYLAATNLSTATLASGTAQPPVLMTGVPLTAATQPASAGIVPPTAPLASPSVVGSAPNASALAQLNATNMACGRHRFCVGWEVDQVYCYGANDGCKWGTNDCQIDSDCYKYSSASPKYSDFDTPSCPAPSWKADAPCPGTTTPPPQPAAAQGSSAETVGVNLHYPGYNCYLGHGASPVPQKDNIGVMTLDACKDACAAEPLCQGITTIKGVSGKSSGSCWLRSSVNLETCVRGSGYDTWMKATAASPTPVVVSEKLEGVNCWASGHGGEPVPGKDLIGEMSVGDCQAACVGEILCKGIVVERFKPITKCWLRMTIDQPRCDKGTMWDTYLKAAASPRDIKRMTAVRPAPAPAPRRKGSFLVLGDWGWDPEVHGNADGKCQPSIANEMFKKFQELGDVKFIINVGDSFYPGGVSSRDDPQWDSKWRNVYASELRSVPWYSVYGNHDLFVDPCTCGDSISECAQVNPDNNDLRYFYMPSYTYTKEHPELGIEIVAMDMNHFSWAGEPWTHAGNCIDCVHSQCPGKCRGKMQSRAEESYELFVKRKAESTQPNLLVFSHYPTDYFATHPDFLKHLSDRSKQHILYFAGHRHGVDNTSTISTLPNTNWLVGGGGGWSCDGPDEPQGFVVGEISLDNEITTYPVLIGMCLFTHSLQIALRTILIQLWALRLSEAVAVA